MSFQTVRMASGGSQGVQGGFRGGESVELERVEGLDEEGGGPLARALVSARRSAGVSRDVVLARGIVWGDTLAGAESGFRLPNHATIRALADFYGCPVEPLLAAREEVLARREERRRRSVRGRRTFRESVELEVPEWPMGEAGLARVSGIADRLLEDRAPGTVVVLVHGGRAVRVYDRGRR